MDITGVKSFCINKIYLGKSSVLTNSGIAEFWKQNDIVATKPIV